MSEEKKIMIDYDRVIADLKKLYEGRIEELEHELEQLRNPNSPPKGWII